MNECVLNLYFEEPDSCYLIKFGKREHLEQIKNGVLRFKPLSFYQAYEKKEKDSVIGDENEGAEIIVSNQSKVITTFNHPLLSHSIDFSKAFSGLKSFFPNKYISCFSYFTAEDILKHTIFSERMINDKNDSVLFVIDTIGFIRELEKALKDYNLRNGLVCYYNLQKSSYNLNEFMKSNAYEYQKEYRFSIEPRQASAPLPEIINVKYKPVNSIVIPINEFKNSFEIIGDKK